MLVFKRIVGEADPAIMRKLFSTGNFDFQKEVMLDISGCSGLNTLVICALSPEPKKLFVPIRFNHKTAHYHHEWELQVSLPGIVRANDVALSFS